MKHKRPIPKEFDSSAFRDMINSLEANMSEIEFERLSEVVVPEILEKYEGFLKIEKGPDFNGTPFDFFGLKDNRHYRIEFKGSLKSFNSPGETQKYRLQQILKQVEGIGVVLLQVKLSKGQYRIFYDEELDILFQGNKTPLEPIISWIEDRTKNN